MPDPITPTLPDPQASVDAALGTAPMGDETPLAFAAPTLNAMPTTPAPTVVPEAPKLEPMPSVGSSYLPPVPPAPISTPPVEDKPKKKSKGMLVMIGIFALIGVLGAMGFFFYNGYKTSNSEVAVVGGVINCSAEGGTCVSSSANCSGVISGTNCAAGKKCATGTCTGTGSLCTPNVSRTCDLIDGCAASQKCNSSGTGWGSCQKNDSNCSAEDPGTGGSGGTCAAPGTNCGGLCINTTSNIDNCGACGNKCSGFEAKCTNSQCSVGGTCQSGDPNCCLIDNGQIGYPGLHWSTCQQGYTCVNHGTFNSCDMASTPSTPPASIAPSILPSPSPSPSPVVPVLACTGLTNTPAAPVIGQTVTFTCAGTITPTGAATLSYKFKYSLNDGADQLLANKTNTTAELAITACGTYSVQCKVCATIAGVLKCDPTWTGAIQ